MTKNGGRIPVLSNSRASDSGSIHLDFDHARDGPQRPGDLGRRHVLAGQLDLDLAVAVVEDEDEGHLSLTPPFSRS